MGSILTLPAAQTRSSGHLRPFYTGFHPPAVLACPCAIGAGLFHAVLLVLDPAVLPIAPVPNPTLLVALQ